MQTPTLNPIHLYRSIVCRNAFACIYYHRLSLFPIFFFLNDTATPEIYPLSLHDAFPIYANARAFRSRMAELEFRMESIIGASSLPICPSMLTDTLLPPRLHSTRRPARSRGKSASWMRSEEHTSELQSRLHLVCRLLLEKK